ncbi:MAG: hypothetical protein AMXMBFR84_45190 [Candidatus Hydrogenedentota bacterium]
MATTRRSFLAASIAAATVSCTTLSANRGHKLQLSTFRFDVTPPMGHSLCGGWIKPAEAVDDPLEAIGIVIAGAGDPIVLCAVDWTGILNDAHLQWRTALAEAAGTTPDRVAVQCVHQHNAPFACVNSEQIILGQGDLPHIVQLDFFNQCLDRARSAMAESLKVSHPLTHIAQSQAKVDRVASNRRVSRNPDGTVKTMRGSSCTDEALRALPEGIIDPYLKTVAFYDGDRRIAACHYYATHPMSYYGDGRVSSDFTGLARKQRQSEDPDCTHLYFTGCAGNVSAGKYNDGSKPVRAELTQRMYDAMAASEAGLSPKPIESVEWRTVDVLPPSNTRYNAAELEAAIGNKQNKVVDRNRPSYTLSWLRRCERKTPIVLSALHINDSILLHLPAECFVEYQLRAQQLAPAKFVATAAYGDGGPWYIPTRDEYPNGGYEVSVAFCDPQVDEILTQGMTSLLA